MKQNNKSKNIRDEVDISKKSLLKQEIILKQEVEF